MSNSSLVNVSIMSPNNSGKRTHKIDTISIHCMAGHMTAESCGNMFRLKSRGASSNYGIDDNGRVGLYVNESMRSWCTSSEANDQRAVTIEVSSDDKPPYAVTAKAYEKLILLCADICRRNGIAGLRWKANKSLIGQTSKQNMTVHRWFAPKDCPGDYLYNRHSDIANRVNTLLGNGFEISGVTNDMITDDGVITYAPIDSKYGFSVDLSETKTDVNAALTSYIYAISGSYNLITDMEVNWNKLTPYIVNLTRNAAFEVFKYQDMKAKGVSGAMIDAGTYFDASHRAIQMVSPGLTKFYQECTYNNIPFGLYFDARAKTQAEAKKEMYQFSFAIRKYPPALGAWMNLHLPGSLATNDKIVETYREELVRLGMIRKMGFYATEETIKQVSWSKHADNWYLWLKKPTSSMWSLETDITPAYFVLNGGL